jgi:regulatory protein YycI of two-component signal transduction system YycFG
MDWSRTKSMFIITFLILNIFLGYTLIERKNESQLDVITKSSIEDLLKEMNIKYPRLPQIKTTEMHISGMMLPFQEQDLIELHDLSYSLREDGTLATTLNTPISLSEGNIIGELNDYVSREIIHGTDYTFWKMDEKTNQYIYFQTYNNQPIYFNKSGMLMFYINEENQLVGYEQSYLTIQKKEVEQEILAPLKVFEVLLDKQFLHFEDTISKIELGYFNLPEISGKIQVLAPTWHVMIGKEHYFVDAIDGEILKIGQKWSGENGITF